MRSSIEIAVSILLFVWVFYLLSVLIHKDSIKTGNLHEEAIDKCEASLPRDQKCKVVIKAVIVDK